MPEAVTVTFFRALLVTTAVTPWHPFSVMMLFIFTSVSAFKPVFPMKIETFLTFTAEENPLEETVALVTVYLPRKLCESTADSACEVATRPVNTESKSAIRRVDFDNLVRIDIMNDYFGVWFV